MNNTTSPPTRIHTTDLRAVIFLIATLTLLPALRAAVSAGGDTRPTPPASEWIAGSDLYVGFTGAGSLSVDEGSTLSNFTSIIGHLEGSQGSVTITDPGSKWINSGSIYVGSNGIGTLVIENGGSASSFAGYINKGSSTILTGEGSSWTTTSTLDVNRDGRLRIEDGGSVSIGGRSILNGFDDDDGANVTVTGKGSTWTSNGILYVAHYGMGALLIQDRGKVFNTRGFIGAYTGSMGKVTVAGAGSSWNNSGSLTVGDAGAGILTIKNGGKVSNIDGVLGTYNDSMGKVTVTGAGSTWNNSGSLFIGQFGTGTLNIENGGKVTVDNTLTVNNKGTVNIEVSGDDMMTVGGDVINKGYFRFTAAPNLSPGDYTPISITGSWSGTGTYGAIGGVWHPATHVFSVSLPIAVSRGALTSLDLTSTQQLLIEGDNSQVGVAFNSNDVAIGGGSTITFRAIENNVATINGGSVLSAWDFETDLDFSGDSEVLLFFEVGADRTPGAFAAWHSEDGVSWDPFETDIFYDGTQAGFLVGGFSSYAITAIPEPATASALMGGLVLAALFARRKKRVA